MGLIRVMAFALLQSASAFMSRGHQAAPKITPLSRAFAKPRAKLPERRVDVSCALCGERLYRYAKGNGAGSRLVKMYTERVVRDFTNETAICPGCGQEFARETMIHGKRALKIVQGKVHVR